MDKVIQNIGSSPLKESDHYIQKSTKIIPVSRFFPQYSKDEKKWAPGWTPLNSDLYTELTDIKQGKYKDKVLQVRNFSDPLERKRFKCENLDCFTPSGLFKDHRSEKELDKPTGVICIDIDDELNPEIQDWEALRDTVADNLQTHCVGAFISVSGKGVATLFRYQGDFLQIFGYIAWVLRRMNIAIDPAPKNIASARFISYDPNSYIEYDFDSLTPLTVTDEYYKYEKEQQERLSIVRFNAKPVTGKNDKEIFENAAAEAEVEGLVLQRGTGTILITSIAGYCNSRGMDQENCVKYFLEHYGSSDYYTQPFIEKRIAQIYRRYEKQHGTVPLKNGASLEISFFDITKDGKGKRKIDLSRVRFRNFFHVAGVGLLMIDQVPILVKLTGATFEQITTEQLKKLVENHINSLPEKFDCGLTRTDLIEYMLRGSDTYFGKGFIEWVARFTPDYLKDTKDSCFLPFRNGVVCITADRVQLKSYRELNKHMWKDQVIDFDIEIDTYDLKQAVWYKFLSCICGNGDPLKLTAEQVDNFFYLQRLCGYLIHKDKDPSRPFAVILAEATETEEKGGGTGKGLFCRGLEQVCSLCLIAGKSFDASRPFAWQRIELHHTIAVIDDVPKKFPLETLFNSITEGLTVERKNQQEIFIPYETSAKIVVISNYVIGNSANSAARRQRIFEFSQFFSPKYTPQNHFNHTLFFDWDKEEWNRFYNTQINCVMQFLKNGLEDREKSDILKRREIRQKYGGELEAWFFKEYFPNGCENWQAVNDLYNDFLNHSSMQESDYSMKRFRAAIQSATQSIGHTMPSERRPIPSTDGGKDKKINFVKVEKAMPGRGSGILDGVRRDDGRD